MTAIFSTMKSGGLQHSAEIVNFLASILITTGGVVNSNATDMKTVAQDSPIMSVKLKQGRAMIPNSDNSMVFPVRLWSSDKDIPIAPNATGSNRKDAIIVEYDLTTAPDATVSNIAKAVVVQGTIPNTAPTDAEISAAISNNPFIRSANVTVRSGASGIENTDIEDTRINVEVTLRQPKIQGQGQDWVTLTDGDSVEIDLSKGNKFKLTTTHNPVFILKNQTKCQTFQVRIKQGAGGGHTFTWFTCNWPDGVAPTPSNAAGKVDKFIFDVVSCSPQEIDGDVVGLNH